MEASARGTSVEPERRAELLDAAIQVFARYGYRKTSMEEVARVAGISRQGLYLHFQSKQALFRETALHAFEVSLKGARDALTDPSLSLEDRLVAAFDASTGRYVELLHGTGHLVELAEASEKLIGNIATDYRARFVELVASALKKAGGAAAYKAISLTPRDVAATLVATSHGLKYLSATRAEFLKRVRLAARLACAPLMSS